MYAIFYKKKILIFKTEKEVEKFIEEHENGFFLWMKVKKIKFM